MPHGAPFTEDRSLYVRQKTRYLVVPYLKCAFLVAVASVLGGAIEHTIAQANLVMFYIMAVVIAAVRYGRGPSIMTAVLSVVIFDLFFVPPRFSLKVEDYEYIIAFITLLVVALTISTLMMRTRFQAETARRREIQTRALYDFNCNLADADGEKDILLAALKQIKRILRGDVAVFVQEGGVLKPSIVDQEFHLDDSGCAMANLVFEKNRSALQGNGIFPFSGVWYLPIKMAHAVFGLLAIRIKGDSSRIVSENKYLLATFANQTALALERARYAEQARQAILLKETEKLHTALLNSVTHDLRTPLASITGSLSSILANQNIDRANQRELIETALEQSERLNQLVGDLLDMARVEAGALHVLRNPCDLKDVIGVSLKRLNNVLGDRKVHIHIPADFPEVPMEFSLMMKVFINILDNACKYSAAHLPIEIRADMHEGRARITIADRGVGIPVSDLKNVFNKFCRLKRPQGYEGTGLGLSICKGIVEAHGGTIEAANRADAEGTIITVTLPVHPQG